MGYTASYSKPYENGYVNLPSKDTPEMAEYINARDNALIKIEDYLENKMPGEYALVTEAGYSLTLNIDENYLMTVALLDKNGNTLSTKTVDFPIESMVVNASYSDGILTLTLQNGNVLDVDISAIVSGLVNDSRTIAGIDLKDDITAEELANALGIKTYGNLYVDFTESTTTPEAVFSDSIPYPVDENGVKQAGEEGQALLSNGDGTTKWGAGGGVSYSTDEQVIGTWIDGKPLYQKTYEFVQNIEPEGYVYIDTEKTLSNIGLFLLVNIMFKIDDYPNLYGSGAVAGQLVDVGVNDTGVYVENFTKDYTVTSGVFTIQYTKSTE